MQNNFFLRKKHWWIISMLFLFMIATSETGKAQTPVTIWSENFNDEPDNAQQGTGTPSALGVIWTADGNLKVLNDRLETTDSQSGSDNWSTTSIPISGYSNVTIKMKIGEISDLENDDQVHVSYTLDLNNPVQIANLREDFTFLGLVYEGIVGSDLYLDIDIKNDASETHYIDDVEIIGTPTIEAVCKPYTASLDANGQVVISGSDVDGGSTLGADLSVYPNTFTCDDIGENTVILTATDIDGNFSTCQAVVTIEDNTVPTLIGTLPVGATNQNLCLSNVPVGPSVADIAALYSDNCGNVIVHKSGGIGAEDTNCSWSVTYHYTIADEYNNSLDPIDITYSGGDTQAPQLLPEAVIPSGQTEMNLCFSAVPAGPTADDIAALFSDNCSKANVVKTGEPTGDNCSWTVTYHYEITDDCGNPAEDIDITYSGGDTQAPQLLPEAVIPSGQTEMNLCFSAVPAGPTAEAIAALFSDNCSKANVVKTGEPTGDNCSWTVTYHYEITDDCGNPAEDIDITYSGGDTQAPQLLPEAVIPSGQTEMNLCFSAVPAGPTAEAIAALFGDNCSKANVVKTGEPTGDNCSWTVTYHYEITDDCGNPAEVIEITYSGGDKTAPVLSDIPYAGTTDTNACMADAENAVPAFSEVLAIQGYTDNCGGVVTAALTKTEVTGSDCDWTVTYFYTVSDACNNSLVNQSYSHSGSDQTTPTVVTKDIYVNLGSNGEVTIAGNAVDDGSYDNCGGQVTFSLSQTTFTCEDIGENEVTLTVTDACLNESTGTAKVIVNVPTITVAKVSAEKARYMDDVTLYAEIESYCGIEGLTGTVEFFLDGNSVGTTDAWPIPAGEDGNPDKLRATILYKFVNLPKTDYETNPWEITAVFSPATQYYNESTSDVTNLYIYPREASPFNATTGFYTGEILAWTTGPNSSTGTITMAATIKDNTPGGDVRGAVVTFCYLNGSTLTPIPSAKNIPVGLINMTDGSIGIASADVQIDIAKATSQDYRIAVLVSGGYTNNPFDGNSQAMVTVAKQVPAGSIFGAGLINNDCSEGQIRGAVGEQTGFSYDVSYNKKMTNPQGRMTITLQSWYNAQGLLDGKMHTYIIKSNAINLFVTNQVASAGYTKLAAGQAVFEAKANLSEQLGDGSLVNIEGNSPLRVTMTDTNSNVDDGSETISISYFRSSGGLWFTSCLNKEITLATEESTVVVKTTTGLKSADMYGDVASAVMFEPTLKVYPNPFTERLNIEFSYATDTKGKLEIYSVTGAKLQTLYDGPVSGGQLYNFEYVPRLVSSQVVFYHLTLDGKTQVGKILYRER